MSDPLSIAAGVIGIAATGFAVARSLYRIADGIGTAGDEVRIYADEIDAFSKLLRKVREELLRYDQIPHSTGSLLEDVVHICERVLAVLNALRTTLDPLLVKFAQSPGKLLHFGLRLQWIFSQKAKLLFYRDALRGQHRVLDSLLDIMILQSTRDRSPQYIWLVSSRLSWLFGC